MALTTARSGGLKSRELKVSPDLLGSFFTSFDCAEPAHVHVEREDKTYKFWLEPLALARNQGFKSHELNEIRRLIRRHLLAILEAWYEHCNN
jgi:Domain of unknown function (DUF4160)